MENMEKYFNKLTAGLVVVGSYITSITKTMPETLQALIIFGGLDYLLGVIIAGSKKEIRSETAVNGFKRKVFNLVIIGMTFILDNLMNLKGVMWSASIWFFISYEAISILEHGNALGFKYPAFLRVFLERIYNYNDTLELSKDWKPNPDTVVGIQDQQSVRTAEIETSEDLKEFIATQIIERGEEQ